MKEIKEIKISNIKKNLKRGFGKYLYKDFKKIGIEHGYILNDINKSKKTWFCIGKDYKHHNMFAIDTQFNPVQIIVSYKMYAVKKCK